MTNDIAAQALRGATTEAGFFPERTWTIAQLAELLQVDPKTVARKVQTREWPHLDLGPRTKRFTEQHVARILAMSESRPPTQDTTRRRGRRRIV
ncbi:hypothetical protein SPF06_02470 [Sinomonas sp. JGH33]|uniref:Helix-turn-helix domain-containing protein n=1 Tax=Sinomonas terricola TaxID=3110330 RepID=A0ABU5T1N8_9MICC|nr:hypothetical protein [Sinomonas sp. JGH33]MEA5453577.1 hypothetical protein [Sinomonas sp. JGH33]